MSHDATSHRLQIRSVVIVWIFGPLFILFRLDRLQTPSRGAVILASLHSSRYAWVAFQLRLSRRRALRDLFQCEPCHTHNSI